MKHTPGPWKIGKEPFGVDYMVTGPLSVGICDITHHVGQNCEADARLIAAAPEMLDVCQVINKDICEWCQEVVELAESEGLDSQRCETACPMKTQLRAAIAKAKGE
ncbi:hypothetical protein LCGC14_1423760 [marine sediment metagenome]|uniref:Uncharacterized protein n=1 Tax=marine sediment metagenome TaxID=412755 RepID=A0A0F9JR21_9ZZZZ